MIPAVIWLAAAASALPATAVDSPTVPQLRVARVAADSPVGGPQRVRAIRLARPVVIDGALGDAIWRGADRVAGFLQRDPNEGTQPTESTVVYVAYDDAALYVGARMYDAHADSIVARLARRDAQTNSDAFTVFIDPYHDRRSGAYFGINAAGTLSDGTLFNDEWDDNSWDGVWEGRATRDSLGWTAELRIPYSQLRFIQKPEYVWGINFKREIARKNERDYLVYTPKNGSGFVSRFPDLVGIERIVPPRRVEIMPYLTTRAAFTPEAPGDPFNDGSELSPGMGADAKIGLGSNLTLNATVNPDFGQVEVDPAVVNLSDVETFFNEKRPFFIEGSSIFDFGFGGQRNFWSFNWPGPRFFYSRRIGRSLSFGPPPQGYADGPTGAHILGALKLTGKLAGSWNVGGLTAVTARERATFVDSLRRRWTEEIEPPAVYGVYRAQKEFAEGRQGLGFLTTAAARDLHDPVLRDARNSHSLLFGVDGWTFLDSRKTWVTTGWVQGSRIAGTSDRVLAVQQSSTHYFQQPDARRVSVDSAATSLSGVAARFTLAKQRGNSFVNSALGFISPAFDLNDLGFLSRAGIVNMHLGGGYSWTKPGKVFRYAEAGGAVFRNYDWDGNINWSGIFHFGSVQLLNYSWLNWNLAYNPWTVNNRRTRGGPLTLTPPGYQAGVDASTDGRKAWVFSANTGTYYRDGDDHEWWAGASVQYRPAPNVSVSVGPNLSLSETPTQYIGAFDDTTATATYGTRYVFAHLRQTELGAGIRLNWTYSPALSLQWYVQPLISAGRYNEFKQLARPRSDAFDRYGENGSTISFDDSTRTYRVDPDGAAGPAPQLKFDKPDFSLKSLRGNAVLRWEYLPGSTLYLVWTQSRSLSDPTGDFAFGRSVRRMFQAPAENIFMIKVTYWWNP